MIGNNHNNPLQKSPLHNDRSHVMQSATSTGSAALSASLVVLLSACLYSNGVMAQNPDDWQAPRTQDG